MVATAEMWREHDCPSPGLGYEKGNYSQVEGQRLKEFFGETILRVAAEEVDGNPQERCLDCNLTIILP